jgi:heme exporter protein B
MLGALAQGGASPAGRNGPAARESLFSILAFPLLLPLLLAGIRTGAALFAPAAGLEDYGDWVRLILACDAVFSGAGLLLFGFIYDSRE